MLACIYWLTVAADVFFVYEKYDQFRYISKPLLLIILILLYLAETGLRSAFAKIMLGALLCSWAGDILLLFNDFFTAGLVAFLAAHILYIVYLLRIKGNAKGLLQFQPLFGIPVIAWWLLLLGLLNPFLDQLKIPVIVYATILCTVWMLSLNLFWKVDKRTAALFFFGAGQFVLSDSVLAINRFVYPFDILPIIVMITYTSAQFLLVKGSIRHLRAVSGY